MKAKKGSQFERQICKLLSLWWTHDHRDDVFWRSSQSGGRATQRAKSGKATYGSYGDIAAVDPVGEPLLKLFTIELKRGSTHKWPGDLLDFKADNRCHKWVGCLRQAARSAEHAASQGWMIVAKRDFRETMVYMDKFTASFLHRDTGFLGRPGVTRFDMLCGDERFRFIGMPLKSFLARVSPPQIIKCLTTIKRYKKI